MSEQKEEWAVVELMGHVRVAGKLSEVERFGSKMGRIDIPIAPDPACMCKGTGRIPGLGDEPEHACPQCGFRFVTQFFGGGSVYRITAVSEEAARAVARSCQPEPVHAYELPRLTADVSREREDNFDDDEDDAPQYEPPY